MELYNSPDSNLKKNTKVYKTTKLWCDFYMQCPPYIQVKKGGRTGGSKISVDGKSRTKVLIAAYKKQETLKGIKRKFAGKEEEIEDIQKLITFILEYNKLAKLQKLYSTYTEYPVWSDGFIHSIYDPSGTNTGRLASYSPKCHWGLAA